ncbi:hypothetical protein [Nocardia aurantiaca]|uniref:Uncharacterized protein n=1 Tax=Nocardia aurantiaca TaxID=2675850 RepID=A0A6I3KRG9_9NOCA|nr:hypothetical protein [Nocardia aurantiaca]MTE11398.1 hypothetical protein [Nocardia aurantiaca]
MGGHPQRTAFYGMLMLVGVMLTGLRVRDWPWLWLRALGFAAQARGGGAVVIAFIMTFRDLS